MGCCVILLPPFGEMSPRFLGDGRHNNTTIREREENGELTGLDKQWATRISVAAKKQNNSKTNV